eukprot:s2760_g9.t1
MLEHLAVDRNFPEFVEAFDMGRCASKIKDFQLCMDVLGRTACFLHGFDGAYNALKPSQPGAFDEDCLKSGRVVGKTDRDPVMTAKSIVASRITFPGPPSFDPRPYFDSSTLERYDQPISKGFHPSEVAEAPPRVSVRATPKNRIALFAKLAASGRLKPIPKASFHAGYTSGLFAVVKDQSRDRMILDGRPANLLDRGQHKWCQAMASGATLSQLYLPPDRDLAASGEDLRDFFFINFK